MGVVLSNPPHIPFDRFLIPEIDTSVLHTAQARQSELTKPLGSLGVFEEVAIQIAGIQQSKRPLARPAKVLIFAADHPVTTHGVSAFPASVTPAMVHNILNGGAASSVMASALELPLELVDLGVNGLSNVAPTPNRGYFRAKAAAEGKVGDLSSAEAMSQETFEASVEAGIDSVDRAAGTRLLVLGELGIGNTTVAAALCAHLLDTSAEAMVGRGTGVDDEVLAQKTKIVQKALCATSAKDVETAIVQIGGREIAAMYGAIGYAASQRITVVLDGFVASAAALALVKAYPAAKPYLIWAHQSVEQGHATLLDALQVRGLLNLEFRLGEATGALAAFSAIDLACRIHNEMATFADAAVPNRGT